MLLQLPVFITLIFIFSVLTKQATGMGYPGSTAFSINGDSVKQPNTEGRSWLGCLLPLGPILMRQRHTAANYSHSQTDAFGPRQPPTIDPTPTSSQSPFLYMSILTSFPPDKNPYRIYIMHVFTDKAATKNRPDYLQKKTNI